MATLHKTNPLFQAHPDALQLAVYNDDIELGNPLGSRAGVNKLTMYYFMVTNSLNRSSLSSIHLAMVAHASDVKRFGHTKILKPLIDDLKLLENGIELQSAGAKVYGTVVNLPGDNLAANESQGFVGSFSANYFCRFCKMHSSDCKTACKQVVALLRTQESHMLDLQKVGD